MRRSIAALAGLALTGLAVACSLPASAATRAFPVPAFSKLRVEGPYTVRVRTGSGPSVNARGPQARIDRLVVEPRGDLLVITTEKGWSWRGLSWSGNDNVVVDVTVPALSSVALSGSGDVDVDKVRVTAFSAQVAGSGDLTIGRIDSSKLTASVAGSGDLTISGRTGRADLAVGGSGDLQATGLSVDLLTASVAGSGDIGVGPTRVAKANVAGSGDIHVGGRPSCTRNKVGSGDIYCGN